MVDYNSHRHKMRRSLITSTRSVITVGTVGTLVPAVAVVDGDDDLRYSVAVVVAVGDVDEGHRSDSGRHRDQSHHL